MEFLNEALDRPEDPSQVGMPPAMGDKPTYEAPHVTFAREGVPPEPHAWFAFYSKPEGKVLIKDAKKVLDRKFRNPADANLYYQALRRAARA